MGSKRFVIEGMREPDDIDADAVRLHKFRVTDPSGAEQTAREAAYHRARRDLGPPRRFRMDLALVLELLVLVSIAVMIYRYRHALELDLPHRVRRWFLAFLLFAPGLMLAGSSLAYYWRAHLAARKQRAALAYLASHTRGLAILSIVALALPCLMVAPVWFFSLFGPHP